MTEIERKARSGLVWFLIALLAMLLAPARTLDYWEAWVYWAIWAVACTAITVYFLRRDPDFVARRSRVGVAAEPLRSQKIIQGAASVAIVALMVTPGIERHFVAWGIPPAVVLAADALVLAGFWIMFLAFRENRHAAAVVEVTPDQPVISTGPYARARHPLYSGGALLFLATPPALGSVSDLVFALALIAVLVFRLSDEERYLRAHLRGYDEYCRRVRFRLLPYVW